MDETFKATVVSQLRALESQIVRAYDKGSRRYCRIGETLNKIRRSVIEVYTSLPSDARDVIRDHFCRTIPDPQAGLDDPRLMLFGAT
jgi:hypothetical protein